MLHESTHLVNQKRRLVRANVEYLAHDLFSERQDTCLNEVLIR